MAVPLKFWNEHRPNLTIQLFELDDPPDGVPDFSEERAEKLEANRRKLAGAGVEWNPIKSIVMAGEETLLAHLSFLGSASPSLVVLDITCFQKRYFCFFLRRILMHASIQNVIATYVEAGSQGYTEEHLASDPTSPDTFPGFAGSVKYDRTDLVVAVGFEALGLHSLILSLQSEVNRDLRFILPFPSPVEMVRRQWQTLRDVTENDPRNLRMEHVGVAATWDAEFCYQLLEGWHSAGTNLTLAPFGPKTHTLAMALFAIKHDASLWYTQPKVYHPDYTRGIGTAWEYVVKWRGIICFDR